MKRGRYSYTCSQEQTKEDAVQAVNLIDPDEII